MNVNVSLRFSFCRVARVLLLCLLGAHSLAAQTTSSRAAADNPSPAKSLITAGEAISGLPPLPAGVASLSFSEFFKSPVGPFGLELSEKIQQLNGRRVRILGFMVQQSEPWNSAFLLAPVAVQMDEHEYGQADDLPPATLYVRLPMRMDVPLPYTRGPMLLTGTLRVGRLEIESGRRTWVTLELEAPTGQPTAH